MRQYIVRSTGAWDRYRDEIRAGLRKHCEPLDALCLSALSDANGLDCLDDGNLLGAMIWFEESAWYLLEWPKRRAA